MYWSSVADGIHRAELNGAGEQTLVSGTGASFGIAVHPGIGRMYFSEHTGFQSGRIRSAALDGSNLQTIATNGYIFGVSLDVSRSQIWWASNIVNTVRRANLDGSGAVDIAFGADPVGLAVDPVNGKVYWSDAGDSRIRRANLDGSAVEVVVPSILVGFGGAIAVDVVHGVLYWAENAASGRIWRGALDGSNPVVIVTGLDTGAGVGLAVDPDCERIYWTERTPGRIVRANLDGTGIQILRTGLAQPTGIALVGSDCTVQIERLSWGNVKQLYRSPGNRLSR
jgi:hypothetical protein